MIIYLKNNLSNLMFSLFLFLFAVEPIFENIEILDYIVWSIMILCGVVWLASFIKSIVKKRKDFMSKSLFSFFDIASSLIGSIISYSLNSHLFKMWIFLLVINIIFILIPSPRKQQ